METGWKARIINGCLFVDEAESGKVVLQHNSRPGLRPYIHPLRAPDGSACLTEDSPGHHPWQHGIETGFHGVNGCDFWFDPGQRPGELIGTIEPTPPRVVSEDPLSWCVEAVWRHADGSFLLVEGQTWSMTPFEDLICLDMDWRLQAIPSLCIDKNSYGGLFIRMPFRDEIGASVLNSAGQKDDECEQQAAVWVDLFMPLERSKNGGGITLLDHPGNADHPALWRVDANRGINPSPCIPGPIELGAGESWLRRYRLVLRSGPLTPERIQELWTAYAG